jgi:hypothetical protein
MFKPCRIRLIITNLITSLITTRIMRGIHRCHFPSAGAAIMVVDIEVGMVADTEVAIELDKAADRTAAVKE